MILYLALMALLLLGRRGTDIGRLRPVEAVQLYEVDGIVFLKTDTGDLGWGLTLEQAIGKLRETTPGQIYLDTADFLLLEKGTEKYLPDLGCLLKKRTLLVYGEVGVDLKAAVEYLRIHKPSCRLGMGRKPGQILAYEGGKMNLKNI